jgi:hypothetical protein
VLLKTSCSDRTDIIPKYWLLPGQTSLVEFACIMRTCARGNGTLADGVWLPIHEISPSYSTAMTRLLLNHFCPQ